MGSKEATPIVTVNTVTKACGLRNRCEHTAHALPTGVSCLIGQAKPMGQLAVNCKEGRQLTAKWGGERRDSRRRGSP